jgi:hypothetical protein
MDAAKRLDELLKQGSVRMIPPARMSTIALWPTSSSTVAMSRRCWLRKAMEDPVLARKHKSGPESHMLSAKTMGNGSIQITSAEAGRLKVGASLSPGSNREEITWTEVPILAGCHRGRILHRKAIGILYGTR